MTRLYVELSPTDGERVDKSIATPEYVMNKARQVMAPFKLEWKSIGMKLCCSQHIYITYFAEHTDDTSHRMVRKLRRQPAGCKPLR